MKNSGTFNKKIICAVYTGVLVFERAKQQKFRKKKSDKHSDFFQ